MKGNMGEMQGDIGAMQAAIMKMQHTMIGMQLHLRRIDVATDGLRVSMVNANTAIGELRGTFASLEEMLKDHARRLGDLEDKQAS